MRLRNA
jgi:transcription factor IIIB subunit 2